MHEMQNFHEDNIEVCISEVTVNDFILDEHTLRTDCARYKTVKLSINIDTGLFMRDLYTAARIFAAWSHILILVG
ncbi:hypothetical protein DPMN_009313 [Dreissena polymorpha]|uniref:Uncharacterized protein n=1 Tax=Dreissena polymorpha TaxID=45954 RepID=A0A9D4N107_DREPO|nr:hypothetical protein DPMN_009313 [Dreissena polymorpha]